TRVSRDWSSDVCSSDLHVDPRIIRAAGLNKTHAEVAVGNAGPPESHRSCTRVAGKEGTCRADRCAIGQVSDGSRTAVDKSRQGSSGCDPEIRRRTAPWVEIPTCRRSGCGTRNAGEKIQVNA